jgi:hypothetical protein
MVFSGHRLAVAFASQFDWWLISSESLMAWLSSSYRGLLIGSSLHSINLPRALGSQLERDSSFQQKSVIKDLFTKV